MSVIDEITLHKISSDQFVDKEYDKRGHQIYIHHTASDPDPYGVIAWWQSNKEAVGTPFVIAGAPHSASAKFRDGEIVQIFPSNKAAWHLGLKQVDLNRGKPGNKTSSWLNLNTLAIEMCNWGAVEHTDKGFKTYAGNIIADSRVVEYPTKFRGYQFYERYTDAQLESMRKLLRFLCDRYEIPSAFKGMAIFDIDPRALRGEPGIFSHVSVRVDKQDCHPQKELLQMLSSL